MLASAKGLHAAGHQVIQWMIATPRHPFPSHLPPHYPFQVHHHFTDTRVKWTGALLNLFQSSSYNLSRFVDSNAQLQQQEWLQKHPVDIIQAESIYVLTGIESLRKVSTAPIILRAHNVEYLIWQRMAEHCRNPLKKAYLRKMSARLKREELAICNQCDGLVVMSDQDAELFRKEGVKVPITVVGISTDLQPTHSFTGLNKRQLFHLGAMDWLPNREGIEWFIHQVWPDIHRALPEWKLVLAGKHMPQPYTSLIQQGIQVKDAPDAAAFMQEEGIMIVPLLSGSGIRVKIIEGLALGRIIITTPIGLEGIPAEDGKHLLIAYEPADFLRHLKELIASPELAKRISENALTFANEHFRSDVLTQRLIRFYESSSSKV